MPLDYKIVVRSRVVYTHATGAVTTGETISLLSKLAKDPLYISPMKKLVDLRFADDSLVSQSGSLEIAEEKREFRNVFEGERCALVASSDHCFGVARMIQTRADEKYMTMAVFREFKDALQWLDLEAKDLLTDES